MAARIVESKVKSDSQLAGANISVMAADGAIVLNGSVDSIGQKDHAEQIVIETEKAQGSAIGVMNNLIVSETGNSTSAPDGGVTSAKPGAAGVGTGTANSGK
jgi:hypothetical protein